ncbi:MAG TPA: hypothetical protein VF796_10785 [Humisphaera sp.]
MRTVSKAGYTFCRTHWQAERDGQVKRCPTCLRWNEVGRKHVCTPPLPDEAYLAEDPAGYLSSTKVGKHFGLSNTRMNLVLAELGWIERYGTGWVPTDQGNAQGANVREGKAPYVVWPESILRNAALRASVAEQFGNAGSAPRTVPADPSRPTPAPAARAVSPKPVRNADPTPTDADASADFRLRFPATLRAMDGHMVRSRAELLIDNWLYVQGIVHAYERRLPVEEECYCDFYLPAGHAGGKGVYIEFWGRESDPAYRKRMDVKRAIYAKYGFRLVELGDADIERLDDVLPKMLTRLGIDCQ